jgi:uncharacterized protein (TIGR03086 family)
MDSLTRLQAGIDQARPTIASVTSEHYQLPTPCTEWDVAQLVNHMLGALTMYRDVAVTGAADPSISGRDLAGADPLAAFDQISAEVIEAWNVPGRVDGMAALPWAEMPAALALEFPATDMVVHTWDLATAIGHAPAWDDDLVAATTVFCREALAAPDQRGPAFAPPVAAPSGATPIEELVNFLGRAVD